MKMKANNMTANEKRLATMRANLENLETAAGALLEKGDNMTAAERAALLEMVNIAYHDSGKIEGAASIDGSASCDFCMKMRGAAEENILIICGMCYAAADSWKEAAWRRHKLNARILSSVLFTKEELSSVVLPSDITRINEDGDVINVTHARNILRIIETHGNMSRFGFWFKNHAAVAAGLDAEGVRDNDEKRRRYNARFVQSSILIGFPAQPQWFSDVIFTVYPDKETTLEAIASGAHECNGRKCKECGWNCYNARKNAEGLQHVAEYLRTNKAKRSAVMEAYTAKKESI
jgi:hypothetical protein